MTAPSKATESVRFHDLDALRAFAMMLGIVLHTALFLTLDDLWPVRDAGAEKADALYTGIHSFIHGFRMPVFFLLSGFFCALLWQRRGLPALIIHRIKRIAVPLAASSLTILPLLAGAYMLATGEELPLWALPVIWIRDFGHLWFLWYLVLITAAFVLTVRLGLRFLHPVWWLAIPLTFALQFLMSEVVFGPDNESAGAISLVPRPVLLAYYALFFAFGAFFYRRGFSVKRWWTVFAIPAVPAFVAGMHFIHVGSDGPDPMQITPVRAVWACLGENACGTAHSSMLYSAPLQAAFAWSMCFGAMGLFRWIAAREIYWVRYLCDASYWIYLGHLPLVMALQTFAVDWPMHHHLKFLAVCGLTTGILLVLYRYAVRYTFIGRGLNGRRAPRGRTLPAAG